MSVRDILKKLGKRTDYLSKVTRKFDFDSWDEREDAWEYGYRAALADMKRALPPVEARLRVDERPIDGKARIWVDIYVCGELFRREQYASSSKLTKEDAEAFCRGELSEEELRENMGMLP